MHVIVKYTLLLLFNQYFYGVISEYFLSVSVLFVCLLTFIPKEGFVFFLFTYKTARGNYFVVINVVYLDSCGQITMSDEDS